MCKHGDTVVTIIGGKPVSVDRCIAQLVIAINSGGAQTVASCCGHGHRPGRISLRDGRELFILPSYEAGQELDATFPLDINGDPVPAPTPAPVSAPDALAFLDAQADKWAAEVNLPQMVAAILSLPDRPQRIEAEALARQAFIEGAYRAATALRTPHGLPGEALKFRKEHYGATVATLIDTEDTIVEISARPDGDYELIVHNREGERDTFRDCSALLKPKHFAALGTLANRLSPASREDV